VLLVQSEKAAAGRRVMGGVGQRGRKGTPSGGFRADGEDGEPGGGEKDRYAGRCTRVQTEESPPPIDLRLATWGSSLTAEVYKRASFSEKAQTACRRRLYLSAQPSLDHGSREERTDKIPRDGHHHN